MTTGKSIALTIYTFVSKVMLLLFNMLSSGELEVGGHDSLKYGTDSPLVGEESSVMGSLCGSLWVTEAAAAKLLDSWIGGL